MKNQTIISLLCCLLLFVTGCSTSHQGNTYDIMTYGAKGDGQTDDAAAIQRAINACSAAGGGTVIIPAGHTFLCGPLYLKSYVNLHLEPNSRLLANPDESIYTESAFRENRGEGMMWISGKDLKQISITGTGEIDGNGIAFMGKELDDSYELKPVTDFDPRPHVLTLINVEKTVIRDITIRNSAYWTIHLIGCYDALIDGISLLNNLKIRNGDGIDVDHSKKVRIANCFIESGDDCICLKNRREFEEYGSCEDIVVTNCIMTSRSCAIKIGSENMDKIDRINGEFDEAVESITQDYRNEKAAIPAELQEAVRQERSYLRKEQRLPFLRKLQENRKHYSFERYQEAERFVDRKLDEKEIAPQERPEVVEQKNKTKLSNQRIEERSRKRDYWER